MLSALHAITRVANYRYNFLIATIDKIFKIIATLSVIGDNFGNARNTIAPNPEHSEGYKVGS